MHLIALLSLALCVTTIYGGINDNLCGQPFKKKDPKKDEHIDIDDKASPYSVNDIGWVATVQRKDGNTWKDSHCIASIISDNWLLTAASCLSMSAENYRISVTNSSTAIDIDKIVKYRRYNPTVGAGYDMALIKLNSQLSFGLDPIRPLCLDNTEPTVKYGWLLYRSYHPKSDDPGHVSVVKLNIDKLLEAHCHDKFKTNYNSIYMMCADHSLCQKNNGAPIVSKKNGKYYLSGMASWPQDCQDVDESVVGGPGTGTFDAYTKIYYKTYYDWILDTTK